jgi:hypothetical protein
MPLILWFYLAGMTGAVLVGVLFYVVVGTRATPLLASIFGEEAGRLGGRSLRMLLVLTAVLGGLSTQWYGCSDTSNRQLAKSQRLMAEKATDQVSQATLYATRLLVATTAVGAVVFAALQASRGNRQSAASRKRAASD